jgi:asparagine synthase (glutamine-hydrolysing)
MSGIAGIYNTDGSPANEAQLQSTLRSLAHRGPDGIGTWLGGTAVMLGHRMLRATPESRFERQPLATSDNQVCVTADARIDNRDELRSALADRGISLRSDSDTELILQSYEAWGEDCPNKLLGDFAFAVWDGRKRRLFCARDPIGIKPLYYHFDGTTFRFASTAEALLSDGTVPRRPNIRRMGLALLGRRDDRDESLFADVVRLPAAHTLCVHDGRLSKSRYWDIDPTVSIRCGSDAEYAERFLELFRSAISVRMRGGERVGVLVSGGLDSSSVACVAKRALSADSQALECYSIVFNEPSCDERQYVDALTRECGIPVIHFAEEQYRSWLELDRTAEYPGCLYSPTLFMMGPALERAQAVQLGSILTGVGGDDILASSVSHLTDLTSQRRFGQLFRQLRSDAELLGCSRWPLVRDYCVRPFVPGVIRSAWRSVKGGPRDGTVPPWLNGDSLRAAGVFETAEPPSANGRFPCRSQQRIRDAIAGGWNTTAALDRLDGFVSHFGLDCRHPFLDRRLVEFAVAIPEDQRWSGPWRKAVLRRAMTGILPETIRTRRDKADFTPFVDRQIRERQAEQVDFLLQDPALGRLGLIHVAEFHRLLAKFRDGGISGDERLACHAVIGLELWYRLAIDSSSRLSKVRPAILSAGRRGTAMSNNL